MIDFNKNIKKDLYGNKGSFNLENIITSNDYYKQSKSFHVEYRQMIALAENSDDLELIAKELFKVLQHADYFQKEESIGQFKRAYNLFIETQKILAKSHAEIGDFETVEKHIKYLKQGIKIEIGFFENITLEPKIEQFEIFEIMKLAAIKTTPDYFIKKIEESIKDNKPLETDNYLHLLSLNLEANNIIKFPNPIEKRSGFKQGKYIEFEQLQLFIHKKRNEAYGNSIKSLFEKATYLSLNTNEHRTNHDRKEIGKLYVEAENLFKQYIQAMPSIQQEQYLKTFYTQIISYFELLNFVREDSSHPFREQFKQTQNEKFELIVSDEESLVLSSTYKKLFNTPGIFILRNEFNKKNIDRYLQELN